MWKFRLLIHCSWSVVDILDHFHLVSIQRLWPNHFLLSQFALEMKRCMLQQMLSRITVQPFPVFWTESLSKVRQWASLVQRSPSCDAHPQYSCFWIPLHPACRYIPNDPLAARSPPGRFKGTVKAWAEALRKTALHSAMPGLIFLYCTGSHVQYLWSSCSASQLRRCLLHSQSLQSGPARPVASRSLAKIKRRPTDVRSGCRPQWMTELLSLVWTNQEEEPSSTATAVSMPPMPKKRTRAKNTGLKNDSLD